MDNRVVYRIGRYNLFAKVRNRIDEVVSIYQSADFSDDINNILELHNILKYIEKINTADGLTQHDVDQYNDYAKNIKKVIGCFFSKITGDNFDVCANDVDYRYVSDFWYIMCNNKQISSITNERFAQYINKNPHHINDILAQQELAVRFSEVIYEFLLDNQDNIRIIISYLLEKHEGLVIKLYITDAFSSDKINSLLRAYINSDHPNVNMLRLIKISQNDHQIGLDDEVRVLARKREQEISEKLSETATFFRYGIGVSFEDVDEDKIYSEENHNYIITYNKQWIYDNLDYPTLLNNFIYLFEYTDKHFCSSFPKRENYSSFFTDLLMIKGKKTYNTASDFNIMRTLFTLQMAGYCALLQDKNIELEDIFKWFFEEYLKNEFSVLGFNYNTPSLGTSYLEKCRNIASEIESVLKQYKMYCKNGSIDRELFEMSSEHIFFSHIASMQKRKYIYAKSEKLKICMKYLFSDSLLCCLDDCDNLFEMLSRYNNIYKDLFTHDFQRESIERLLDFGVVIEMNRTLHLNFKMVNIMYQLYEKGVLCYNYYERQKDLIDQLLQSEDLEEGATLFSLPEQQYLDYILNKATFSDGLDLRNKYSHGTNSKDEKEHFQNYLEFLKIMVLIIIKINEEFCLKYPFEPQ